MRTRTPTLLLLAGLLATAGCSDSAPAPGAAATDTKDGPDLAGDAGSETAAPDGPSEAIFARERVLEVMVDMPTEQWDALRAETRGILDVIGPGCLDGPKPSPFTWFEATVTIDGHRMDQVGIRKKGFLGSLDPVRPSLKLKFDKYVDDQLFEGAERLTLNNGKQDPSRVSQCIAYDTFTAAGVPAPRCNFAHVTVNGQDLGVYVNVEPIKKAFLRRHFEDDEGVMFEGALSDFRAQWVDTFEKKQPEPEEDPDRSDLDPTLTAMDAGDDELIDAVSAVFDLDAFIDFWAAEVLVGHWDGYAGNTNNFYLYKAPSDGLFHFVPWGVDGTLIVHEEQQQLPASVMAQGILARRLYLNPDGQQRYLARLSELLDEVWDGDALVAEIDELETMLQRYVPTDRRVAFAEAIAARRGFVADQEGRIRAELEAGPVPWQAPLREPPCLKDKGQIAVTFQTTWGTAEVENLFTTGTGTLELELDGTPWAFTQVGAKAGAHPEKPGLALIVVAGQLSVGGFAVVWLEMPLEAVAAGADLELFGGTVEASLIYIPPGGEGQLAGFPAGGTLELQAAGRSDGATLSGTITSPILSF